MKIMKKKIGLALLLCLISTQSTPLGLSWLAPVYDSAAQFLSNTFKSAQEYPKATAVLMGLSFFSCICALVNYKYKKQLRILAELIESEKIIQQTALAEKAKTKGEIKTINMAIKTTLNTLAAKKIELVAIKKEVNELQNKRTQAQQRVNLLKNQEDEQERLTKEIAGLEAAYKDYQAKLANLKLASSDSVQSYLARKAQMPGDKKT